MRTAINGSRRTFAFKSGEPARMHDPVRAERELRKTIGLARSFFGVDIDQESVSLPAHVVGKNGLVLAPTNVMVPNIISLIRRNGWFVLVHIPSASSCHQERDLETLMFDDVRSHDAHRLMWIDCRPEPDAKYVGWSAARAKNEKVSSITLREYLSYACLVRAATGRFPDEDFVTICAGSRFKDTDLVPVVSHSRVAGMVIKFERSTWRDNNARIREVSPGL